MPRVFKIGSYIMYFWVNENDPLEPVHVHVCEGYAVSRLSWDVSENRRILQIQRYFWHQTKQTILQDRSSAWMAV